MIWHDIMSNYLHKIGLTPFQVLLSGFMTTHVAATGEETEQTKRKVQNNTQEHTQGSNGVGLWLGRNSARKLHWVGKLDFWFAILIFWVKWVGALELLTSSMTYHDYWIASWIFSFSQQAWGRRSGQSGQGKSCSDRCQGGKTQLTRNFWRFGASSKIFGTRQLLKMAAIPIQPGQRGMAGGNSLSYFKI